MVFLSSRIRDADRSFLLKWGGSAWPNTSHLNSAAKRVIYYPCCASCSPHALFIERLCNFHPAEIPFLNISKRTITETLQKQYRKIFMQTCINHLKSACNALRRSHGLGLLTFVRKRLCFLWPSAHCRCNRNKHTTIGLKGTFLINKSVLDLLTRFCVCFLYCYIMLWYVIIVFYKDGHLTCLVK